MLTIFLPPYPFRGINAPYLWVFYKFLSEAKEPLHFLIGGSYLQSEEYFSQQDRWEVKPETCRRLRYTLPTKESLSRHTFTLLENDPFEELLGQCSGNPLRAFKAFLTERTPILENALEKALADKQPEAIISWTNCPSLEAIASKRDIPVVHSEIGPLRAPFYRDTGYLDFSGVNGNTEAEDRYFRVAAELNEGPTELSELRNFFLQEPISEPPTEGEYLGLPFQVEDDSNLIAYGNGYDNQGLAAYARLMEQASNILVRPHPGSLFTVKDTKLQVDNSPNSVEFLAKCKSLVTINSSMGLEALLFEKSIQALGDSSYSFILSATNKEERAARLGFYLFCYIVPFTEIYNSEYIRFRLGNPSEIEILQWHLNAYEVPTNDKSTLGKMILKGIEQHMTNITTQRNIALNEENEKLRQVLQQKESEATRFAEKLDWHIKNNEELEIQLRSSENSLKESHEKTTKLAQELVAERTRTEKFLNSLSWRATAPLRASRRKFEAIINRLPAYQRKLKHIAHTIKNDPSVLKRALQHILKNGLKDTISHSNRALQHRYASESSEIRLSRQETTYILTTQHCLFVAEQIKRNLEGAGFPSDIIFQEPDDGFASSLHFVICPQIFKSLPGLYVAFQMEQSVSSRWFDENYIRMLENSFAIFDYSLTNIKYLQEKGISLKQLYYTPISYIPDYWQPKNIHKEYDVLFYGDANNERRRDYLNAIRKKYKTKIINNIFGEELYREIAKARLVVNIHYYEGALLETTRVYECLSLGAMLVSESSPDVDENSQLQELVDFVPVGDIEAMLRRVEHWLENPSELDERVQQNEVILRGAPNLFNYYFNRFLLASDNISFDEFFSLAGHNIEFRKNFVCLGLPESTERKDDFEKDNSEGFQYFPGLRHSIGWIGCGLSYKFIIRKAFEQQFSEITVCEDDVEFLPDWKERFDMIHSHLKREDASWDIFSGLIANLHAETNIKSIEKFEDFELIHLDKMTSTVLNTYNSKSFQKIISWDENDRNPAANTIDRFIERQSGVEIITTIPFLVGHKEEMSSTLWGFKNTQYRDMISASSALLQEKADSFKNHID